MGRKPKPTKTHKRQGTYRKDRHGDRSDLDYDGQPKPMRRLSGDAKKAWDFLLANVPDSVLASVDSLMLTIAAESYAHYRKATTRYNRSGKWKDFCTMQASAKQLREIASRFGGSPIDRTKIKRPTTGGNEAGDVISDLLAGHSSRN